MEDEGFEVYTYGNPSEVLSDFKPHFYDLLLIDINMPKMNGFELYDKLKKIDNKVKVCYLTAFSEGYHQEFRKRFQMYSSSNISFVRKPIR